MRKVAPLLVAVVVSMLVVGGGALYFRAGGHDTSPPAPADPLAHMPAFVQTAAPDAQQAYLYAVAHPAILREIPCYCGCMAALDHQHNLDCYVTTFDADGRVAQFSEHGAYCATCINITQVVMEQIQAGKTVAEIHALINSHYGYAEPDTSAPALEQRGAL